MSNELHGLRVEISDVKRDEKVAGLRLKFRLRNTSSRPIYIYERWNSWGAYQWKIELDVGGKIEVYKLMGELISRGAAIVMISSELPEILGLSDRILVMREGSICGEFDRADATEEKILNCALRGAA